MIRELHSLRDTLDYIHTWQDGDDIDPSVIDAALDIIERLLHQHEKPDPVKPNACMRLPTPPAPPPPKPVAPQPRPENQRPQFSQCDPAKPRRSRKIQTQPQEEAA